MIVAEAAIDKEFKHKVAKYLEGRLPTNCDTCGVCSSSCPVHQHVPGFDPRRFIRMINLGYKDELLGSTAIWYCALCNTCTVACPQDVRFKQIMEILHKVALAEGYVPPSFVDELRKIEQECQAYRCEQIASRLIESNPKLHKTEVK
jgi:heterodisulfide reductase subunit C